ncbi:MAG: nucleoside monophosphate kinase [Candidatus Puniceispirillales bacterium]
MIIAIDGSAGSGKGTLAKNLSKKLNLKHLDTGVLFRIIASQAIDLGIDDKDERLKELSKKLTIENVEKIKVTEKEKLKSEKISQRSSEIAIKGDIRSELIIFQRKYAQYDKSTYNGIILDAEI